MNDAPRNPKATVLSGKSVRMEWDAALDAQGVRLPPESTTLTVPAPSGSYTLKLSAINGCGVSRAAETTLTVEASPPAIPGPPIELRSQVQAPAVTLRWSPPTAGADVTRYIIEVFDTNERYLFGLDSQTPATTFVHGAVPPGEYIVRVRARTPQESANRRTR